MKYSLDIFEKEHPFANVEIVNDDRALISVYEGGKIARKLFYMNKGQLKLLVNGLLSVITLMNED